MKNGFNVPSGLNHLEMIENLAAANHAETMKHLAESSGDCWLIGMALSALFQAATCHRKCHGGGHVLESLCGRIYNLAVGAYLLAERGSYDESLNLIRSIGEASNLIALSVVDKAALKEWLVSDKKKRLREFSPSKIREALERREPRLLLADGDWYSRFCETYTHVTPQTRPNVHNPGGHAHVGAIYQAEGLKKTLEELARALGSVSLLICRYFKFSDLYEEICAVVRSADGKADFAPGS